MADGRHFENGFIPISHPRNIRFRCSLVCRCKFGSKNGYVTKKSKFCKFKIADGGHI